MNVKQLTIEHAPGTVLSGPWRREDLAEQSAGVFRHRGIEVEVERREKRWVVVEA